MFHQESTITPIKCDFDVPCGEHEKISLLQTFKVETMQVSWDIFKLNLIEVVVAFV